MGVQSDRRIQGRIEGPYQLSGGRQRGVVIAILNRQFHQNEGRLVPGGHGPGNGVRITALPGPVQRRHGLGPVTRSQQRHRSTVLGRIAQLPGFAGPPFLSEGVQGEHRIMGHSAIPGGQPQQPPQHQVLVGRGAWQELPGLRQQVLTRRQVHRRPADVLVRHDRGPGTEPGRIGGRDRPFPVGHQRGEVGERGIPVRSRDRVPQQPIDVGPLIVLPRIRCGVGSSAVLHRVVGPTTGARCRGVRWLVGPVTTGIRGVRDDRVRSVRPIGPDHGRAIGCRPVRTETDRCAAPGGCHDARVFVRYRRIVVGQQVRDPRAGRFGVSVDKVVVDRRDRVVPNIAAGRTRVGSRRRPWTGADHGHAGRVGLGTADRFGARIGIRSLRCRAGRIRPGRHRCRSPGVQGAVNGGAAGRRRMRVAFRSQVARPGHGIRFARPVGRDGSRTGAETRCGSTGVGIVGRFEPHGPQSFQTLQSSRCVAAGALLQPGHRGQGGVELADTFGIGDPVGQIPVDHRGQLPGGLVPAAQFRQAPGQCHADGCHPLRIGTDAVSDCHGPGQRWHGRVDVPGGGQRPPLRLVEVRGVLVEPDP